jgi:signal transduction histidine kinase
VLRYAYRLEGVEREWRGPSDQRAVTYANLEAKAYRFEVRAVNADGMASPRAATVEFRVLPPVWRSWWFELLAAVAAAGAVFWAHQVRVTRLLELERVRTRIATDLHDDIGASLSQIAVLSEVARAEAARGGGRADELLARIATASRELVDTMSEIVWAVDPHKERFRDLAQHMREFAGDVLIAQNISLRFGASDAAGDQRLGMDARRQVFLIFKECVHNIARHSGCAQAAVDLTVADEWLTLKVSDDGRGFDPAAKPARGRGLENIRRRARSLGGNLEVNAVPDRGVTVVVRVPLARAWPLWSGHPPKWAG